nr:unnamed protein product [Digitaria exilis]
MLYLRILLIHPTSHQGPPTEPDAGSSSSPPRSRRRAAFATRNPSRHRALRSAAVVQTLADATAANSPPRRIIELRKVAGTSPSPFFFALSLCSARSTSPSILTRRRTSPAASVAQASITTPKMDSPFFPLSRAKRCEVWCPVAPGKLNAGEVLAVRRRPPPRPGDQLPPTTQIPRIESTQRAPCPMYGSFTCCDDCALALDAIGPLMLRSEQDGTHSTCQPGGT